MRMPLASTCSAISSLLGACSAHQSHHPVLIRFSAALRVIGVCALLVLSSVAGWSQSTGSLSGTVKDPTGATVSKAIVKLVNDKTGAHKELPSGDAGQFEFKDLDAGMYTIEVVAPGFATFGSKSRSA